MQADNKSCRVIVPDDQLSLAIGKEGQNARLAAKLTGCKIDIAPESQGEKNRGRQYGTEKDPHAAMPRLPRNVSQARADPRGALARG